METVIHLKILLTTMIALFWIVEDLLDHQAMVLVMAELNLSTNVWLFARPLNTMVKSGKTPLFAYFQKLWPNTLQLVPPKAHVLALPFVNQCEVHITNEMEL